MIPLAARRTFRLAAVMGLSLALAYGLATPLPFLAPLFALYLTAAPAPPMGAKSLLGLLAVVCATLGIGLVLAPMLRLYPVSGVLTIAAGLFASTWLGVGKGKGLVSTLLSVGLTMIPAAGLMGHAIARSVVEALLVGISIAIACQWVAYPFVPEDAVAPKRSPPAIDPREATWIALRTTLVVLPPVLLALTNPSAYMPIIMKAVQLGQQGNEVAARAAGRELLGSTVLGGGCALALWFGLKAWPSLWMFFLWTLLFGVFLGGKLYGVFGTRLPPSFWLGVGATTLILLGPAVEDSGDAGVKAAFVQRFVLFVAVTVYAWGSIVALQRWRGRRIARAARG